MVPLRRRIRALANRGADWLRHGLLSRWRLRKVANSVIAQPIVLDLEPLKVRYLINLILHLRTLGHPVLFRQRNAQATRYEDEDFAYTDIRDLIWVKQLPRPNRNSILVTDRAPSPDSILRWRHVFEVSYRYFEAVCGDPRGEIILPFGVHPHLALDARRNQIESLRIVPRRPAVLFAGATHRRWYQPEEMRKLFGKIDRIRVLEIIREALGPDRIHEARDYWETREKLERGELDGKVVVFEYGDQVLTRIPRDHWMSMLAQFQAMVCPPGGTMPLCHNLIEAMSVGTIPITQYGEMLDPPLRQGVNMVGFSSEQSLVSSIEYCLRPENERLPWIQLNGVAYYDRNLAPGVLAHYFPEGIEPGLTPVVLCAGHRSIESWKATLARSALPQGGVELAGH